MNKTVLCLGLVGLLAFGGQAYAELCANDDVPAATLLLPYFQVDLADPNGLTTLFSINNASATAQLAHVTVWTEFSIPVLDFDVFLTGFDIVTINLRDIIVNGILPVTSPFNPAISPVGVFSLPGGFAGGFAACAAVLPYSVPALNAAFRTLVQQSLTGQPVTALGGLCRSRAVNTSLARGYITVDSVTDCSQEFPSTTGYFAQGGAGTANNNNSLWGDYFYVDSTNNFAQGETLVHIEANASVNCDGSAGNGEVDHTFYQRYTTACEDNREILPNAWWSRYLAGGTFSGGTDLIVWRGDFVTSSVPAVACGSIPAPMPFQQNQLVVFDEDENPLIIRQGPSGFETPEEFPFPLETNVATAGVDFTVDEPFGMVYANLNDDLASPAGPGDMQAWVTAVMSAEGRFSVGLDGIHVSLENNQGAPFRECSSQDWILPDDFGPLGYLGPF